MTQHFTVTTFMQFSHTVILDTQEYFKISFMKLIEIIAKICLPNFVIICKYTMAKVDIFFNWPSYIKVPFKFLTKCFQSIYNNP